MFKRVAHVVGASKYQCVVEVSDTAKFGDLYEVLVKQMRRAGQDTPEGAVRCQVQGKTAGDVLHVQMGHPVCACLNGAKQWEHGVVEFVVQPARQG